MGKKNRYIVKIYTTGKTRPCNYSSTIYLVAPTRRKVPAWLNPEREIVPKNHGFNNTRKNKIVMGKRNAWPLPRSKGNRF